MLVCNQRYEHRNKPYPGTLNSAPLNNNQPAAWLMSENSGTTTFDVTTMNNATIHGATWATGNGLFPNAPYLNFDGIDDYCSAGAGPNLDFTGDFSVFARVYINYSFPAGQWFPQIIARNGAGGAGIDGWNLDYPRPNEVGGTAGSLRLIFKASGRSWGLDEVATLTKFTTSQWVNLCAVREGSSARIYVNGVLDNTATCSANPIEYAASPQVSIGRKVASGFAVYWRGGIDAVRMWARPITDAEVVALHLNPYVGII